YSFSYVYVPAPLCIYPLSLHDALPMWHHGNVLFPMAPMAGRIDEPTGSCAIDQTIAGPQIPVYEGRRFRWTKMLLSKSSSHVKRGRIQALRSNRTLG